MNTDAPNTVSPRYTSRRRVFWAAAGLTCVAICSASWTYGRHRPSVDTRLTRVEHRLAVVEKRLRAVERRKVVVRENSDQEVVQPGETKIAVSAACNPKSETLIAGGFQAEPPVEVRQSSTGLLLPALPPGPPPPPHPTQWLVQAYNAGSAPARITAEGVCLGGLPSTIEP